MKNMEIKSQSGFSIMEATIALSIITFGMMGILSLVTQNIKANMVSKNSLIASMLAQEGLELVRNIRDENWQQSGNLWDDDIINDGTYAIDYFGLDGGIINGYYSPGEPDPDSRLFIDQYNLYSHVGGTATPTPFYRLISVVENPAGDMIKASSTVRWLDSTGWHNYAAETRFYNWR